MTENTVATGSAADSVDDAAKKKKLIVVGGAVGAVVLGAAGFMLLHGGSSSSNVSAPIPKGHPHVRKVVTPVKKATTTKKSVVPTTKLPAASTASIGRDPFHALYIVPVASTTTTSSSGTPTTGTTGTSSTGTTSTTTSGTTSTVTKYVLQLTAVKADPGGAKLYTFKVGTVSKTVIQAQKFGNYGELQVLTFLTDAHGKVVGAVVQVGDDNPVQVTLGQKISVL